MLSGIALALSEVPESLVEVHGLARRVCDRGGEREVQFLLRAADRLLPVWWQGRLLMLRWGNRRGQSRKLPSTAWARLETARKGGWLPYVPKSAEVPATLGLESGVWFQVGQGIRGLVVHDERGEPVVYPLVEPSSHYFEVMTRSPWMPVLIGERI
jgi:hypothetical protein